MRGEVCACGKSEFSYWAGAGPSNSAQFWNVSPKTHLCFSNFNLFQEEILYACFYFYLPSFFFFFAAIIPRSYFYVSLFSSGISFSWVQPPPLA